MHDLTKKDFFLLILLTLFWGLNWPVMKFGISNIPPLTFRSIGLFLSLPVMWAFARYHNQSIALPRPYILPLVRLAIPNILAAQSFMVLGVKLLSSGRAAILCYTMPVWAVLIAAVFYREKLNKMAIFGTLCAAAGAALLLGNAMGALVSNLGGTLLSLAAAALWGYGTVQIKRRQLPVPTTTLTFWMIGIGASGMGLIALMFEDYSWHNPEPLEWGAILYNAVFVFGIATTIWNSMARRLPPVASGLSIMMVPVIGVFSGAWLLQETPQWQDYLAMLLILVSMSTVLLKPGQAATK